jgi:carbon storage regulator
MEGILMLVLSRKLGEKIMIGDDIVITVVDIDRGKIRLGITAPKEVPVYREELIKRSPVNPNPKSPDRQSKEQGSATSQPAVAPGQPQDDHFPAPEYGGEGG